MPREHDAADQLGPRRDHHLGDAGAARDERVGRMVELVLPHERARVPAEVAPDRPRGPRRQQPLAEQHHDRDRADHERHPGERELEEAEAPDAGVRRGVGHDDVHRRPREREQRARVRAERERQEQLRRRPPEPHGHHDDDGHERRDRAVDVDEGGHERHQRHREDDQPRAAVTGRLDQLLARPRGDPGGVERFADHEQRRDEDHRGIAEARERLLEVEHPGRPQRQRDADRDDGRRHAARREHHHDRRQDQVRDGGVAHLPASRRAHRRSPRTCPRRSAARGSTPRRGSSPRAAARRGTPAPAP